MAQVQKYPTMYSGFGLRTAQDLSNVYEDVYTEVPPYAKDENGKFINATSEPVIKKTGRVNVQEKIQSFRDDVDIYKILEKMALAGQPLSDVYVDENSVLDYSNIPDNINDFNAWVSANYDALLSLPKELSSMIIKDDFNEAEFNKAFNEYYSPKKEVRKQEEEKKDGAK